MTKSKVTVTFKVSFCKRYGNIPHQNVPQSNI
ncbi:rCG33858 [Rattus norvegicus]|uniref:RCG33858 n=1 Tax=Rattus norvegicus TaxID=10116 RepID=A6HDK2_RAT|nr:rCG33858 [Rattus norvegicus]